MFYRADTSLISRLLQLPETGMGYQVIDAKKTPYALSKNRFIVFNAELILDLDIEFNARKRQIVTEGYTRTLRDSKYLNLTEISLVKKRTIIEIRTLSESAKSMKGRHSGGKGAKESDPFSADGVLKYVRLSAYENDIRVDFENKRFLPGTYATTELDYLTCKVYKDDPIDRYALPNDEEIKWAFDVKPRKGDVLQEGIAQPAFDHFGGGKEVFFVNGTSHDTLIGKHPY